MPRCPTCGEANPDRARFCASCGSPLTASPAGETRRTVSVLFADLEGSTALGERLDPEAVRRVVGRYFDEAQAVIHRHGGTVEKFIGDAVMAVFGLPVLHEDDALRAIRAALEMRSSLARLNRELQEHWGVRIGVRTGVNTGEVIAGDAAGGQRLATGDAVNVAARLEQAAAAGEILIGPTTERLVRRDALVEPVAPLALKGKAEPLPAFRLLGSRPPNAPQVRQLAARLVGREQELHVLRRLLDEARHAGEPRLAAVLADPGVGKTRLVEELARGVAGEVLVLRGRCLAYGEGIGLWPLREVVGAATEIADESGVDEVLARLLALLGGEDEARAAADRLLVVLGLSDEPTTTAELAWAVRRLLEALARRRPLLVVVDDLHWADALLLDLLEDVVERAEAPVMLVGLARPELRELRPSFPSSPGRGTVVELGPLDVQHTRRLAAELLDGAELPEALLGRIVGVGDGNPLFVGELLRMLVDEGALRLEGGRWTVGDTLVELRVPPTIEALLAARLDRLRPEERDLLARAAVVGEEFWSAALVELSPSGTAVEGLLGALTEKQLVGEGQRAFLGETSRAFSHGLLREVAYGGLLKGQRADLHERFAAWLELRLGERRGEYVEIIGHHLERAHRNLAELAPLDARGHGLAARAGDALAEAGRRALGRGDAQAAVRLLERAGSLLPVADPRRLELSVKLGLALAEAGELGRADALLAERIEAGRRDKSLLVYRDGEGRERVMELEEGRRTTIGRRADNDLALPWDREVSRHHAGLERDERGWSLVEPGLSRNGSYVNGRRVAGRQALEDGDVLRFGATIVVFRGPAAAEVPPPPELEHSGLTALASSGIRTVELTSSERELLAILERTRGPGAHEPGRGDLGAQPDDLGQALQALARRFAADGLPPEEQVPVILARARAIGLLG